MALIGGPISRIGCSITRIRLFPGHHLCSTLLYKATRFRLPRNLDYSSGTLNLLVTRTRTQHNISLKPGASHTGATSSTSSWSRSRDADLTCQCQVGLRHELEKNEAEFCSDTVLWSSSHPSKVEEFSPPRLSVAPMMDYTDNHYRYLARLLSHHTWLYTEMVVDNTLVHQQPHLDRFLDFPVCQQPLVLQLGGSNVAMLAEATRLADAYGYNEINLNCGCPSDKVAGHGSFGASLMLEPEAVGEAMAAIAASCSVPVTVKCRIGVDNADSYEELCEFVGKVSEMAPVRHFVVHARKAILKGLSPAENRTVPPLKYEYVYALMRDFPHLHFTLNGGITSLADAAEALRRGVHGVMIGRAAYSMPWSILGGADEAIYGATPPGVSRRQVLEKYAMYADATLGRYKPNQPNLRTLVKPLLGLFHAEAGGGTWRRAIDSQLRSTQERVLLLATCLLHLSALG
eukprot:jgi/Mesen1/9579/ME000653S08917